MIKATQETGIILSFGLLAWGLLMDLAIHFNLQCAFWVLIAVLAIGVVWAMIYWPWPRITRASKRVE
ncbi:MAG: hypothetical protein CO141_02640 [Candidatus Moranbacteria bacterium CG_4_9_14_3_um_filter_42_9]|nr:MAG: hypothetical protein CO141_02640 [Candidatus Moranbacteria bacterium CG_4_9_14_3_um_filter_42_9]